MTINWHRVARALAHPLQISILELLEIDGGRTLSVKEMGLELDVPLSNAGYHASVLHECELIELQRVEKVRGADEHFYALQGEA